MRGGYRYIAPSTQPNVAIGIRDDERDPPLWVRWHQATIRFAVGPNLRAANLEPQKYANHLWVPLEIKPATGSALSQISDLAAQVVQIFKVAAGVEHEATPDGVAT